MIKENSPDMTSLVCKEIQKLETIGKSGKINKFVEVTSLQMQMVK
jgi:hypothetical protein